jgi:MoaA/NifB/PqqE/SkfB family radical SAM enzyme/SAM-dependent methyltransferase
VSNQRLDLSENGAHETLSPGAAVLEGWCRLEFEHTPIFVQPTVPDWFVPNARADAILRELQDGATPLEAALRYREKWGGSEAASWEDVQRTLARVRARPVRPPANRADVLRLEALRECWLHISNRCNLACTHCMFGSSPHDPRELSTSRLLAIAAEARELGCRLFYLTGGEPLVHAGFSALCRRLLEDSDAHVVVLTNTLMLPRVEADLVQMPRERVHFQVSVDCPHGHHDAIRGEGSYDRVLARTRRLVQLGFPVTLAMAVDGRNAHHMPELVEVASSLGVASVHYLWHFVRGGGSTVPRAPVNALLAGLRAAYVLGRDSGVAIDNVAISAAQVFALPGTRHDLSNAGWESLAVGPDDRVYPTAAMVLDERLACGAPGAPLAEVWKSSPVLTELRHASVANAPAAGDTLAYVTGGGDVDHSYLAGGRFTGRDPYRELADRIALWLIAEEAGADPGPDHAALLARMGERVESCAESVDGLAFTHSNCVLSLPGKDGHTLVRDFYAAAAAAPQADIANPVAFDAGETAHVPEEAKTRSYGCGSPVLDAAPSAGETVVDLGCGAGMECAIAAKKVGSGGRVIGVDMLDQMLELARRTAAHAARELGHDVIEVRKGFLETIPCPDASADVVISNCVINLSPSKRRTFHEILRVLKPGGRLVVADVVADEEPPIAVRSSERLRGECLGGAMLQTELFQLLEDCGFTAATLLKRFPYRTVAGHRFYSATYRAERPHDVEPSRVVYRGPFAGVVTEDGRVLRRGEEAVAAVPAGAAADPVFVLDGEGAVANVDLGAGCSCFVAPEAAAATAPGEKLTDCEGCMVCGAPLEYLPVAVAQRCHFCGRELSTSARCAAGHFVCDGCHTEDAAAAIRAICADSRETDMVALMRRIRAHPAVSIHGPEHHVLVPAVVVTAARNAGLPVDASHLDTAIARGRTIAGGACAFIGACGAALGVGTGFSVILGINPYQGEGRQTVQQLVGRALARVAALPAARCCQRDCWLALQEAAASSEELLGVRLPADEPLVCEQVALNEECLHADCPLWPRRIHEGSSARTREARPQRRAHIRDEEKTQ